MSSSEARDFLIAELERLERRSSDLKAQLADAQARLAAARLLLSPEDNGAHAITANRIGEVRDRIGLRDAIRKALEQHPNGLRAEEVVDAVTGLGYKPTGTMSAKALVYSELYRLHTKLGRLDKRGEKYRLPQVTPAGGGEAA
ncbi:MAG: hypothetical protein ABR998_01665 [Gemmatimonadales bacterium]|jgi:hypothetical protein